MYESNRKQYDFNSWISRHSNFFPCVFFRIIILGISLICSINTLSVLYSNRIEEPARYELFIAKGDTISYALAVSNGNIDDEIYTQISSYNTHLAKIKANFNNPAYSLNFSGDYDWNALNYILF